MKKETRGGKFGRNYANLVNYIINNRPADERNNYRISFLEELKTYSFKYRKKGSPKNSGCVHELSDIDEVNLNNPVDFAKLVKEQMHLMYQKNTTQRVFDSLIANL
ncbi:MAG: hypothetical protein ABIF18_01960 [archaeon]